MAAQQEGVLQSPPEAAPPMRPQTAGSELSPALSQRAQAPAGAAEASFDRIGLEPAASRWVSNPGG
jgi:hypothetical protein